MKFLQDRRKSGLFFALLGYGAWGFIPLFWRLLHGRPYAEVIIHRIIFAAIFFAILLAVQKQQNIRSLLSSIKRYWPWLLFSGALIAGNWAIYLYSVHSDQVLQASLGYFINPLVNVFIGRLILKEALSRKQAFAVFLAALGVIQISLVHGGVPLLALALAISFSIYGLIRKMLPLDTLSALTIESLFAAVPLLFFLPRFYQDSILPHPPWESIALYVVSGAVTGLPLYWYSLAARRISFSTLGFLQYISPSVKFFLAVFLFHESFTPGHARGFGVIWLALAIYSYDIWKRYEISRQP